jgi:hypothetical protein
MTSTRDRAASIDDQSIEQDVESYGMTAPTTLYYPSLKGNSWDDELLPSGD